MVVVGIQQKTTKHILYQVCEQLRKKPYIIVNGADKISASTCTTRLPKNTRIIRERRNQIIGSKVYEVVDELRMNSIVDKKHIEQYLNNIRQSIQITQAYISIRQNENFLDLRNKQFSIIEQVFEVAGKRSKYMDNVAKNKPNILSYLYREIVLVDKLGELDIKLDQMCAQYGVSGAPFFEAGKLVGKVWGVVARSLFNELGKK